MSQRSLPPELLNWLQNVLQPEYISVITTYRDVADCLQSYPTLRPRTRVYTSETGYSQLLLCIYGIIPLTNSSIPGVPVEIWIPKEYPALPPFGYVTPNETLMILPNKHADVNGRIYHPYIAFWGQDNTTYTLKNFISNLSIAFSRDPPLIEKSMPPQAYAPYYNHNPNPNPNPHSNPNPILSDTSRGPPDHSFQKFQSTVSSQIQIPPLPPKPQKYLNDASENASNLTSDSKPGYYKPQPSIPTMASPSYERDPYRTSVVADGRQLNVPVYREAQAQTPVPPKPVEAPDIMDREASGSKVYLEEEEKRRKCVEEIEGSLNALMATEVQPEQQTIERRLNTLKTSVEQLEQSSEMEILNADHLKQVIQSNMNILDDRILSAKKVLQEIENSNEIPVDDILCAENVVYNQLYDLVADDQAIGDTIYYLGKGLDGGSLSLGKFLKHTRILAREQFMKRALTLKIAELTGINKA